MTTKKHLQQVVCVERDPETEPQAESCGLERVLPALDSLQFDYGVRALLLSRLTSFPSGVLPEIMIEPRPLYEKFMAWASASLELNSAELSLNGGAAFQELLRNKRSLELYADLLRRKSRNVFEVAQAVESQPRIAVALDDLHADILDRPSDYFEARSPLPYLLLTTPEYSRFLKRNLDLL